MKMFTSIKRIGGLVALVVSGVCATSGFSRDFVVNGIHYTEIQTLLDSYTKGADFLHVMSGRWDAVNGISYAEDLQLSNYAESYSPEGRGDVTYIYLVGTIGDFSGLSNLHSVSLTYVGQL